MRDNLAPEKLSDHAPRFPVRVADAPVRRCLNPSGGRCQTASQTARSDYSGSTEIGNGAAEVGQKVARYPWSDGRRMTQRQEVIR